MSSNDSETKEETPPPQKITVVELRREKKDKKTKKKKKKDKKEKERKPKIIKVQKIESDEEAEGMLDDDGASSQITAVDRSKRREPPPLSKPKPKPKPQPSQIDFSKYERSITLLQAVARGGFTRNRLNAYVDKIYDNRHIFRSFAAIARGHLVRREVMMKKRYLQKNRGSVKVIQSTFRGVLSRFYTELFLDRLDMESDSVIALQSIFRASRVRNKIKERDAWFRRPENVAKIIKIQSFFRSARAANDFKSLINEKNPPLKAVKNFIGLLSASDVDIEDELNIEKYKEQIVQETKRIEKWEHDLSQLGVKLQLLKRNKISLEEVINFKDDHLSLSEYSHNLNDNLNRSLSANPNSKIAEKSVANLSKLYGKLFYLLQTKPIYLSNILTCLDQNPKVDLDLSTGNIEDWIMKIFNYGEVSINTPIIPDREEFLLMKLVVHSSGQFIESVENVQHFKKYIKARQSLDSPLKHFEILLSAYINLPQQRLFAKNFLGDCVLRVTGDDEAWYEPDPTAIFKALLTKAELNGEISLKSMDDLKTQDPIDDPETRNQFVQNLTGLREAVFDITKRIEKSIEGLPLFIRCVCKEIYMQLKKQYPGEPERFYLSSIGTIFIKSYIIPMFIAPENYGVHLSSLEDPELARNNLLEVAKVLNQLVLMRPFGSSNAFLQPLNPFLEEFIEGIRELLKDLIDIEMIEECYQMSVYDDVSSNVKPVLRLSTDEILEVLELIKNEIDISAPEKNNLLRYIMLEISELIGSTHNKLGKGMINLKLEPVAERSIGSSVV
ncbi:unnamed protein product [Ambrosiozyma monospora]|uniref:Unnamed protein product n=1 Tax=Ambrosiozyma monospora TaxID=43982 RepID=A0ACB5SZ97_AMBMO|nr:unnamed protein product [Ambrosiozyma monospora]